MTLDELQGLYTKMVRKVRAEKRMREYVFRNDPVKRDAKVAEMDELEQMITELKDALKPHCEPALEQQALLDVPRKAEYK